MAEPVAPVDRLCSLTAIVALLCGIDSLFTAEWEGPDIDHGHAGQRVLVQRQRTGRNGSRREGRRSSEPPIEKPKPGAPRVLGSGIELDADLGDRVPLHVAHD